MPNLFADIPPKLAEELCETLLAASAVRIERIVSQGQASPEGFWYDQGEHEWVVLLAGAARLTIGERSVELRPGDYVHLPAHQPHRVEWTPPDMTTVWLAVFYR